VEEMKRRAATRTGRQVFWICPCRSLNDDAPPK
jgi:hypothetical protein